LDADLIRKITELDVNQVFVYLRNSDVELLKRTVYLNDSPPSREALASNLAKLIGQGAPSWAHPRHLCRDIQCIPVITEVMDHLAEICTNSTKAFELLAESRLLTHPQLAHCHLATVYALIIGIELDFNVPALIELGICGMFFDIGKLRIPFEYLSKPGKLTDMEYAQVKKHTYFSRQMVLKLSESFPALKRVALEHHENYFGGGYPRNLRSDDIHPFSQIVAIADKFAAMLTSKEYRPPYLPHEAFNILNEGARMQFAPNVFKAFKSSVLVYPRACFLKLSNGAVGYIADTPADKQLQPVLELVYSEKGTAYVGRRPQIDLSMRTDLTITAIFRSTIQE
jgi:HD-GYP domain-containing protein (c-di-GMP phosphodiesterase class II)